MWRAGSAFRPCTSLCVPSARPPSTMNPGVTSRPISFARRPKSRIICGVALGDMNVEKTPIFILLLPRL